MELKRIKFIAYSIPVVLSASILHLLAFGFPSLNGLIRYKIIFSLLIVTYFFYTMAAQEFFKLRVKAVSIIALALFIALECTIIFSQNSRSLVNYCGFSLLIIIVLYSIYFTGIFLVALYRDPIRFRILCFIAAPIMFTSLVILKYLFLGKIYAMPLYIMSHLPLSLSGIMLILIFDIKIIHRENTSLSRLLIIRTQKLKKAMNILKKEGARPMPHEVIHNLIEYLDENFSESYNRIELAERFNLNSDYMCQIFKKTTGLSISNYIYHRRVDAAKQLLEETDSKIIDIAYHVGFENLTHFHKFFKKQTDVTPTEYRRTARKSSQKE